MASDCVHISTVRRFSRSTSTPANGARRNVGICPAKLTTPSSSADPVSRYTSHAVAMRVIHVPISEMLCPPKNSRKFRCRSARHVCEKSRREAFGSAPGISGCGGCVPILLSILDATKFRHSDRGERRAPLTCHSDRSERSERSGGTCTSPLSPHHSHLSPRPKFAAEGPALLL